MAAPEVELRNAVYLHLFTKLIANSFSYNGFHVRESWLPKYDANSQLLEDGVLSVISTFADRECLTRSHGIKTEPRINILFQKNLVKVQDVTEVDKYANLVNEFIETLRKDFDFSSYAWQRAEFYRDSSSPETAVSPTELRQGCFEMTVINTFTIGVA